MNRRAQKKPSLICEWCNKEQKKHIATHHLIPIWLIGDNDETIEVCNGCHRKLEARFNNFIKYQNFSSKARSGKANKAKHRWHLQKRIEEENTTYLRKKQRLVARVRHILVDQGFHYEPEFPNVDIEIVRDFGFYVPKLGDLQ